MVKRRVFQVACCTAVAVAAVAPLPVWAADAASASVGGVVRDRGGAPQIGALVQLLRADFTVAAVARTDTRGVFELAEVLPGTYRLRATENSFLPVLRDGVHVLANRRTVTNVTLSTLFDTTDWLPAKPRAASEPDDDWMWTLRSSTNRPLLRFIDDSVLMAEGPARASLQARLRSTSGGRAFGAGGPQTALDVVNTSRDGRRTLLRAKLNAADARQAEYMVGFEQPLSPGRTLRTVVALLDQPRMTTGSGTAGLQAAVLRLAESAELTQNLTAEIGNELDVIRFGGQAISTHPFANLNWHSDSNTVGFALATTPQVQHSEDIADDESLLPGVAEQQGRLALEHGLHQELRFTHKHGETWETEVAFFHDRLQNPIVNGGGFASQGASTSGQLLFDPVSGSLRAAGPAFSGTGMLVEANVQLTPEIAVSTSYSVGRALSMAANEQSTTLEHTLASLQPRTASSLTLAAHGKVARTGTRWRTVYRLQPTDTVTAVDPYDAFLEDAYLSLLLREPIHLGRVFPGGMEAMVDVRNLLAQGYRPFVTSDGNTLFFAQTNRSIQGGVAFTF